MASSGKIALILVGAPGSGVQIVGNAFAVIGYEAGRVSEVPVSALSAFRQEKTVSVFEQSAIVKANQMVMNSFGASTLYPRLIQELQTSQLISPAEEAKKFKPVFAQALDETFSSDVLSDDTNIVLYDSGFSFTLNVWAELLTERGFEVQTKLVHRPFINAYADALDIEPRISSTDFTVSYAYHALSALDLLPAKSEILQFAEFQKAPEMILGPEEEAGDEVKVRLRELANVCFRPPARGKRLDNPLTFGITKVLSEMRFLPEKFQAEPNHMWRRKLLENNMRILDRVSLVDNKLPSPPPMALSEYQARRPVVVHIHLFKNAGTSVDGILKENFSKGWREQEFPSSLAFSNTDMVRRFLSACPDVTAFSTHTGNWFLDPKEAHFDVIPVVFVRHPILRVKSAYGFEKKQEANTEGSRLARQTNLAGYVQSRLDTDNDFSISNFQSWRLSFFFNRTVTNPEVQAMDAVDRLPFVGRVEEFDQSMKHFSDLIRTKFPDFAEFSIKTNVSNTSKLSHDEQLDSIREEIGDELYDRLLEANQADLALVDYVRAKHFS